MDNLIEIKESLVAKTPAEITKVSWYNDIINILKNKIESDVVYSIIKTDEETIKLYTSYNNYIIDINIISPDGGLNPEEIIEIEMNCHYTKSGYHSRSNVKTKLKYLNISILEVISEIIQPFIHLYVR